MCRLKEESYGLKQRPCASYEKIHASFECTWFLQVVIIESTLYSKRIAHVLFVSGLYANAILLIGPTERHIIDTKFELK